jgi:hypothetical protein
MTTSEYRVAGVAGGADAVQVALTIERGRSARG